MKFSMKKLIGLLVFLVMAFALSAANLDELRWVPKNREALSKLIDENKNQGNYVVFDWDYTSIYQDTQENLFRYQIDNLKFKMTPAQFSKAIRKDIPLDNFAKDYVNVKGQPINITKIANDLDKRYTFLYNNYIKTQKMSLEKIKQTEEFKDFRGKLAFLYEAIGGSFSHDVAYPWVLYLFENMSVSEVQKLAKEANDFGIGNKLGKYVLESSDKLTGEAGKVSHQYKSGLRTQPETANLFHEFEKNGIKVYIVSASLEDIVKVFASNKSYGYNLDEEKIYAMRLKISADDVLIDEFNEDYAFTQKEGKSETIERFIKDKYEGKGPILVGGDALGDESMLTKFKDTEVLLIMKREGKLDNLVNDERALIQHRNLQTGLLDPQN
mgnify:CR=1 FL=1